MGKKGSWLCMHSGSHLVAKTVTLTPREPTTLENCNNEIFAWHRSSNMKIREFVQVPTVLGIILQ